MSKEIIQEEVVDYKCDNCKELMLEGIPVAANFGYGSFLDGKLVHFCSDECFINWVGGLVMELNEMMRREREENGQSPR